jgi:hypothetical protein
VSVQRAKDSSRDTSTSKQGQRTSDLCVCGRGATMDTFTSSGDTSTCDWILPSLLLFSECLLADKQRSGIGK